MLRSVAPVLALVVALVVGGPLVSQVPQRLASVIPELEGIVAELETGQVRTEELRRQLAELEALATDHQRTLESQAQLLDQFRTTVASLQEQLERERAWGQWWWPVTGVAVVVAGVEAALLFWGQAP